MALTGEGLRRRRFLPAVLCVIFGILAVLSDVFRDLIPIQLIAPLTLVSVLGFGFALYAEARYRRTARHLTKFLSFVLVAIAIGAYAILLLVLGVYQDTIANRTSVFFHPWPLSAEAVRSHVSPRVEELAIETPDGLRLQGWLVKNGQKVPAPLVIYFGGSGSSGTDVISLAQRLEGWSVAIVNYRGFGLSEGTPTHANALDDATLVYDTLAGRPDVDKDRIVAMGYSLGSAVAVYLSSERAVAATVLVAPFDSMTLTGVRRPLLALPLQPVMKHYFNSVGRAPAISTPLLCLLGLRDVDVPPELALKLMGQWGGETEVQVYPQEDHDLLLHDNSSWADIASFLNGVVNGELSEGG